MEISYLTSEGNRLVNMITLRPINLTRVISFLGVNTLHDSLNHFLGSFKYIWSFNSSTGVPSSMSSLVP